MNEIQEVNGSQQEDFKFHKHLDVCRQCRENPFKLCPVGAVILQQESVGELTLLDGISDDELDALRRGER